MREIKFKVWNGYQISDYTRTIQNTFLGDGSEFKGIESLIFLQYTGLKDRNGVEIYADCDVFKFKYMTAPNEYIDLIGVMNFNDEDLRFEIDIYPETDGYICLSYIGNGQFYDFEIIGNAYENPELIES